MCRATQHLPRTMWTTGDATPTGFFLDQRDNRALVGRLARGRRVLNVFGYTGA